MLTDGEAEAVSFRGVVRQKGKQVDGSQRFVGKNLTAERLYLLKPHVIGHEKSADTEMAPFGRWSSGNSPRAPGRSPMT